MVCPSNRLLSHGINPTPGHQPNLEKTHMVTHRFIISCDNEQNSLKIFLISDKDGCLPFYYYTAWMRNGWYYFSFSECLILVIYIIEQELLKYPYCISINDSTILNNKIFKEMVIKFV